MTIEHEAAVETRDAHGIVPTLRLVVLLVFLKPFGNLALAWGMKHVPAAQSIGPLVLIRAFFEPFVALGIAMHILWLVLRMSLLSLADLSFVLPLTALGYVISALLGRYLLREQVTPAHWVGILLIFAGVVLGGSTARRTTGRV